MPDQSKDIKDSARKECIYGISTIEHRHGKAIAGIIVEANLEAMAIYLRGAIGPEAAYNVFQRYADDIAGILTQQAARSQ